MSLETPVIGILGAGRVGTALARLTVAAGYETRVATARPPSEIALLLELTAPGALPDTAENLIAASDIIVLALPLPRYRTLRPDLFAGKVVIDAMNYWAPTDGRIEDFEGSLSSSEVIQRHLPQAALVRAFNHMGYHELEEAARPAGDPERRGMAIAGNGPAARRAVAALIEAIGFDPVDAGELSASRRFGVGTEIFGAGLDAQAIRLRLDPTPLAA